MFRVMNFSTAPLALNGIAVLTLNGIAVLVFITTPFTKRKAI